MFVPALTQLSWFPQECRNSITANPAYSTGQLPICLSHATLHGVTATLLPAPTLPTLKLIWIYLYRQLLHLFLERGLTLPHGGTLGCWVSSPALVASATHSLLVLPEVAFSVSKIPLYKVLINYVTNTKRNSGHRRFFHATHGMIITERYIEKKLIPDSLGFFTIDEPQMSFTE